MTQKLTRTINRATLAHLRDNLNYWLERDDWESVLLTTPSMSGGLLGFQYLDEDGLRVPNREEMELLGAGMCGRD